MKLKRYFTYTRAGILEFLNFRASLFVTFFGNLCYLTIIYFLWKAIFDSSPQDVVNGMTFTDTMIYLVLAMALFNFMDTFLVWFMGRDIQSGKIVLDLIKPVSYSQYRFFFGMGNTISSFFITVLPTILVVYFITGGAIPLGWNLLYFAVGVGMGIVINFSINFFVGTICIYTQSIWGINIMKEVIVLLLSGASIPIAFFPEPLKTIVSYLPFQAIYNIPLQMLINDQLITGDYIKMLCIQVFWLFVTVLISQAFWKVSLKKITINGG